MKKDLISIIIRTYNEERWISKCLKSIFSQKNKNFEIIIVDNFSTDKTLERAKKFNIKKIIKIKDYFPGKALNLGIQQSSGEFIVMISAHCIPKNNNWLSFLFSSIKENENLAGVYGRQEPMNFSNDADARDLSIVFGLDRKFQIKDSFFHNANSIIRKKVWKKVNFDNKTKNIEDRLWGKKIIKIGYKILYDPKASVYHYHGIHQNNNKERLNNIVKIIRKEQIIKEARINPKDLNIIAIIPIKGKSLKINKKHLLELTISNLKKSKFVKKIFVSTDEKYNQRIAIKHNVLSPFLRPKKLSKDIINLETVQKYSLNEIEKSGYMPDLIVHVEETFPFRESNLIDNMIIKLLNEGYDSVIASKREVGWIWKETESGNFDRIDTGDIPRKFKEYTLLGLKGLCTITYPEFIRSGKFIGKNIGLYEINSQLSEFEVRNKKSIPIAKKIIQNTKILV